MTPPLEAARAAFAERAWRAASDAFAAVAAAGEPLAAADSERWAVAGFLAGRDTDCDAGWEAAHRAAVAAGDMAEAARLAVRCALCLVLRGAMAQAGGWLARAESHVADADAGADCAAAGYVLIPRMLGALDAGETDAAAGLAVQARDIGRRTGDVDLHTLGTLGHGQALLAAGDVPAGLARLDEAMLAVASDETGPIVTGIVLCAVIIECLRLHDLARAAEWTGALSAWCDGQPDLVPYRGQCLVHRSQLHQAAGRWPDALTAAVAARDILGEPPHPALGLADYQEGELRRLRGDFDAAEAAYRAASKHGLDPMPGLALLALVRGDVAVASTAITRALQETRDPLRRAPLLAAAVDVRRAADDVDGARAAADELASVVATASAPAPMLRAMAAHAVGASLLATGDAASALPELRTAARTWASLHLPYEAARTALLVADACAALGDTSAAAIERDNARATFEELGARPDLERLTAATPDGDGLSAREREVLALVAAGKSNRQIAEELFISAHTAGRHVENIFAKLGVSSRAAATAYAYEHGLVHRVT